MIFFDDISMIFTGLSSISELPRQSSHHFSIGTIWKLSFAKRSGAPCRAETQAVGLDLSDCISPSQPFGKGYDSNFPGHIARKIFGLTK